MIFSPYPVQIIPLKFPDNCVPCLCVNPYSLLTYIKNKYWNSLSQTDIYVTPSNHLRAIPPSSFIHLTFYFTHKDNMDLALNHNVLDMSPVLGKIGARSTGIHKIHSSALRTVLLCHSLSPHNSYRTLGKYYPIVRKVSLLIPWLRPYLNLCVGMPRVYL